MTKSATEILIAAADGIDEQEQIRDGESCMAVAVQVFNALTAHALSERDGYLFMAMLNLAICTGGGGNAENFIACAGAIASAGETTR